VHRERVGDVVHELAFAALGDPGHDRSRARADLLLEPPDHARRESAVDQAAQPAVGEPVRGDERDPAPGRLEASKCGAFLGREDLLVARHAPYEVHRRHRPESPLADRLAHAGRVGMAPDRRLAAQLREQRVRKAGAEQGAIREIDAVEVHAGLRYAAARSCYPMGGEVSMKVFNFSAGPAVLPREVLERAAAEMLDWHGSGMSVMEMSHRGPEFIAIAAKAEADLRALVSIPDDYAVLFLQGGAIAENAIVPMNLIGERKIADYVNTGEWSKKSIKEAKKYCQVNVAASSEDASFTYVPARESWKLTPEAAYVHVCTNETIGGIEYHWTPDTGEVPLVADASSHILSRPVDVRRYGVIYAGAQKNAGPAGVTLVIVRRDLLDRALPITPSAFHWKEQAANDSMLNTPPTYSIYVAGLVFEWLIAQGGLAAIERRTSPRRSCSTTTSTGPVSTPAPCAPRTARA
jgi:phosphoserine aminotransferase